jgi:hypothetical protein
MLTEATLSYCLRSWADIGHGTPVDRPHAKYWLWLVPRILTLPQVAGHSGV